MSFQSLSLVPNSGGQAPQVAQRTGNQPRGEVLDALVSGGGDALCSFCLANCVVEFLVAVQCVLVLVILAFDVNN